jgi:hypothetical protein
MSEPSEPAGGIWLSQGRLHFTCASYEQWLAPCIAVALFARDADWLLLPLLAGAGGLQVKMRNARYGGLARNSACLPAHRCRHGRVADAARLNASSLSRRHKSDVVTGKPVSDLSWLSVLEWQLALRIAFEC